MTQVDDQEASLHGLAAMRSTQVLAFLLPFVALGCLAISWAIAANAENPANWMWATYALLGIAVGLVLAYLVLTFLRAHGRSVFRTILSCFAVVMLFLACVLMFFVDEISAYGLFGPTGPPPLSSALQDSANQSAFVAAAFLESGDTGEIPSFSWTSRGGRAVGINCEWRRNSQGILVTASPDGTVPKGQSGVPRQAQALRNGMLGVDLDYYQQEGKALSGQFMGAIFEPVFQFLGQLCKGAIEPISNWAKGHGGGLPDAEEAQRLLSGMKGRTFSPWPLKEDTGLKLAAFKIDDIVYEPSSIDGIFDVTLKWIMKYQMVDAEETQFGTGTGALKLTGTATGLIGIPKNERNRLDTQWMMQTNIEGADVEGSIWGATWKAQDLDPTVPDSAVKEPKAPGEASEGDPHQGTGGHSASARPSDGAPAGR